MASAPRVIISVRDSIVHAAVPRREKLNLPWQCDGLGCGQRNGCGDGQACQKNLL